MNQTRIPGARRPRNPLVTAARFRKAGRHQPAGHGTRQLLERALRHELSRLHLHSP